MPIVPNRTATLVLTLSYDPEAISQTELTDTINEFLHTLAVNEGWQSDEDTGAYDTLDWEYSPRLRVNGG